MNILKKSIQQLSDYAVPQDLDVVKLNQNESPFDLDPPIKEKICRVLKKACWNRYPPAKPTGLIKKISAYSGHDQDGILVANSSNELIQVLIHSVCNSTDSLLVVKPTFSVYSRVARLMDIRVKEVPLKEDFSFPLKKIIHEAAGVPLVMLATPNNPTASNLSLNEIKTLASRCKGLLVLDEAYFEFCRQTAQPLLAEFPNLIIMRTFSKALGLAGIRLGYLLANKKLTGLLSRAKLPFSVGIFQQTAGEAVLEETALISRNVDLILAERQRMLDCLRGIPGIEPLPTQTNFILFRCCSVSAGFLWQQLLKKGILLRSFSMPGLGDYLRVNIGTGEENSIFLKNIGDILARE